MNTKSRTITEGAMMTAIFVMLLLINRYTGRIFEEFIAFILPIPMTAFAIKHEKKDCILVIIAMCLTTFVCGNFTSVFYRLTEAMTGLIFGICLHNKTDSTKTIFIIVIMSVASVIINIVLLSLLFEYNITNEIMEIQKLTMESATQFGLNVPENMLTTNYFAIIMMISVILTGIVQGIITYVIGLLILKRLGYSVEKPKSVYYLYPPKITGWLGVRGFLGYIYSVSGVISEPYNTVIQILGICGTIYLLVFGVICVMLMVKTYLPNVKKYLRAFIAFAFCIIALQIVVMCGFIYLSGNQHKLMMEINERS